MRLKIEFDVASDGYDRKAIDALAEKHGVKITKVNEQGPGGGNPQVFATIPSLPAGRAFLGELYGCKTVADFEAYVDFIIADHRIRAAGEEDERIENIVIARRLKRERKREE